MMAIGRMRMVSETDRYLTIAVDSYDDWNIKGVIFQGDNSYGVLFSSFTEMIINMDRLFDAVGAPSQTFEMRCLSGSAPVAFEMRSIEETERKGKLQTIQIYLRFRYHASWQGTMIWDDGKQKQSFESELQLILLSDAILRGSLGEKQNAESIISDHAAISGGDFLASGENYMEISMTEETFPLFGLIYCRLVSSGASAALQQMGQKASFSVKVMFREHFTWQGIIYWREGKAQQPFRSFKEMLYMIYSVVETTLSDEARLEQISYKA